MSLIDSDAGRNAALNFGSVTDMTLPFGDGVADMDDLRHFLGLFLQFPASERDIQSFTLPIQRQVDITLGFTKG